MTRQRIRKTKLVATIGPACDSTETIQAMIRAGMNVARLNFSHGSHEEHRKHLERIRARVNLANMNGGLAIVLQVHRHGRHTLRSLAA